MRLAFLLFLGVIAATWLEYEFFPGHTYLEGESQVYLPILERLDAPGFLSRDLVATHPNVAHTIYDELTLFLHEGLRLDFHTALTVQQLLCRAAALVGLFLLALSTGLTDLWAFLIAVLLNLGAMLTGPAVSLVEPEAIPRAFAFGLILLAAGLIARGKPLLGGLAGGIALVYEPTIAAPFWAVVILAAIFDRRLRRPLRSPLTILLVFALLWANLAQLQPGIIESPDLFGTISEPFAQLQQYRTAFVWVPLWASAEIWHYLALFVCGLWATARIWPALNRPARWFFLCLPFCGIASIPLASLLLNRFRWSLITQIQPARALLFTVAFAGLACAIAGVRAAARRKYLEACLWFIIVFAIPLNVRILDLFKFTHSRSVIELAIAVSFAAMLVLLMKQFGSTRWRSVALLIPFAAVFVMPALVRSRTSSNPTRKAILEAADWAEQNTWGSSLFLFPDAGRDSYPGIFRAESRRALWVDWNSGDLVPYFESFALEWWQRWQETMQDGFSPRRLQTMLALPADYFVLKRENRLEDIRPVFQNSEFVIYDSGDLKNVRGPLRLARR